MPVTRSATRQSQRDNQVNAPRPASSTSASKTKTARKPRKKADAAQETEAAKTKRATNAVEHPAQLKSNSTSTANIPTTQSSFLPAVLTFPFDEAKLHLIKVDPRFEDIFSKLKCRPFENLERVDPFRTLATSILGQQISWLAARAIVHKFLRLFDPSLPEKPTEYSSANDPESFFPSAHQVCDMDVATLRTAGLSGRKAEYVQDLAARFADGRLTTEKIFEATDEELYEMLIAVRGIGRWTVDMFAIFSLRRPDILPVGDLGVQRGMARWFLSLHSPKHTYAISPKKLPKPQTDTKDVEMKDEAVILSLSSQLPRASTPDASSVPPAPLPSSPKTPVKKKASSGADDTHSGPPPAFTPSIKRTLGKEMPEGYKPPPLPEGLNITELQTRLNGKKKIKGAILTPKEMEDLTECWKPYRTLGVYYMWALSEAEKAG